MQEECWNNDATATDQRCGWVQQPAATVIASRLGRKALRHLAIELAAPSNAPHCAEIAST